MDQIDGNEDLRSSSVPPSRTDILRQLNGIEFTYGKSSKSYKRKLEMKKGEYHIKELVQSLKISRKSKCSNVQMILMRLMII